MPAIGSHSNALFQKEFGHCGHRFLEPAKDINEQKMTTFRERVTKTESSRFPLLTDKVVVFALSLPYLALGRCLLFTHICTYKAYKEAGVNSSVVQPPEAVSYRIVTNAPRLEI